MNRKVKLKVKGYRTTDGAGVNLVRVLGKNTTKEFDPILMLDSFDSTNPNEYIAGFPMHPHRGIETISYLYRGKMLHRDSLGNKDEISDGEIQWMNSGSGIEHEEKIPVSERLLGVQLWLNLPKDSKMSNPSYQRIKNSDIKKIDFDGGFIRLLAGNYKEYHGYRGNFLPLNYFDIHMQNNSELVLEMNDDESVMIFTLSGEVFIENERIDEKTAVKLTSGNILRLTTKDNEAQVLYISSMALNETIAWAGPIVMNTEDEIKIAYKELRDDTFIKENIKY